jgi:hypothetical protein
MIRIDSFIFPYMHEESSNNSKGRKEKRELLKKRSARRDG